MVMSPQTDPPRSEESVFLETLFREQRSNLTAEMTERRSPRQPSGPTGPHRGVYFVVLLVIIFGSFSQPVAGKCFKKLVCLVIMCV